MQIKLEGLEGSGELWLDIMKIICGDTAEKSMVDLGCHKAPYTPLLGFTERLYVDIQCRPLDDPNEQQYFVRANILDYLNWLKKKFDVAIASDVIEHLTENLGPFLLKQMEAYSSKQIIFTPLGPYCVTHELANPDSHKSAWFPHMFPTYMIITIPNFHSQLGVGAFFAVNCSNEEKQRIYNEVKIKYCFYDKN